jgi:hypothetical protein
MDTIQIHKTSDGYMVSDQGTWVLGVYDSEIAAKLTGEMSPDEVHAMWEGVLDSGRDTATIADVQGAY